MENMGKSMENLWKIYGHLPVVGFFIVLFNGSSYFHMLDQAGPLDAHNSFVRKKRIDSPYRLWDWDCLITMMLNK